MMLVLTTQYMENYGDAENPYWKYKGGNDYKVLNVNARGDALELLVVKAKAKIEYSNPMTREYLIGWIVMPDDALTPSERDQLEFDAKITWPATIIDFADSL